MCFNFDYFLKRQQNFDYLYRKIGILQIFIFPYQKFSYEYYICSTLSFNRLLIIYQDCWFIIPFSYDSGTI